MRPRVQSHNDLKQYILRRLGSPVINIEITDEQLDDIIYEALQTYFRIAYGGTQLRAGMIEPKEDGQREFTLPFEVDSVLYVYTQTLMFSTTSNPPQFDIFSIRNYVASDFYNFTFYKGTLLTFELINQYIQALDLKLNVKVEFDYNPITKKLYLINYEPSKNEKIGLFYYEYPDVDDPEISQYIYDNRWIKKYATELARKQWAENLSKYSGSKLPNGLELDVQTIQQTAEQELDKLEQELLDTYQLPPDFYIG